ncbi:cyclic nucleotide-binding domain-containing protein [Desulfotalea psychrophila]|uniref:Cyclic nucleotide-binding domain-containing protein n=1 Tax=Desulfotalea psychrophila (strain LSv54 / DSM 12343) TaxID=177439 RepID=Q6AQC4_DESPS|nr:cyclic nucleotide-binding domain-containing protein [Desulfotalea psychrophila]CAG35449.1 hypothetical protein DP0720 [Desulfotalea psychrophila LSv54]
MAAQIKISDERQRQAVIMMTDMEHYSFATAAMSPQEICKFLLQYHGTLQDIVDLEESHPLEIEATAGDGCLVIFDRRAGEDIAATCDRAVRVAMRLAEAIESNMLPPTRMGIVLGEVLEVNLGKRFARFGADFSVANRLEGLCGYFGCHFLMDGEVAQRQSVYRYNLVNMGKLSLASIFHPVNIYTVYKPGVQNWPRDLPEEDLLTFIQLKNEAMELFSGNPETGVVPFFPHVREMLLAAQEFYLGKVGKKDKSIYQVLKYINENPEPNGGFNRAGMEMIEKRRDDFGRRIFHMSCGFLKSLDHDLYITLVEEIEWEKFFKLEWRLEGDVLITIDSIADGVYYLESGLVEVTDANGENIASLEAGDVFGEIAYLDEAQRRTANVVAETDVVLRKISSADLEKFPVIKRIFEKIAKKRLAQNS